jgi:hypothetical protein
MKLRAAPLTYNVSPQHRHIMTSGFRANRIGLVLAGWHLFFFLLTVAWVEHSADGQSSLVYVFWFPIDLPWSLLYFAIGSQYGDWLDGVHKVSSVLGNVFYPPYLIHGLVGTIWWYFLPGIARAYFGAKPRSKDLP